MPLADMLHVRRVSEDLFESTLPGRGYLFGGCAIALGLLAAGETVEDLEPKSLQVHFLQAGTWGESITLAVARWPDSRSFGTRCVTVQQEGRTLAVMLASFHRPQGGANWQAEPASTVPPADTLPVGQVFLPEPLIEIRRVEGPPDSLTGSWHPYWARSAGTLEHDQTVQLAAIGFISDYVVIHSLHRSPAVAATDTIRTVSHSLWFHRPVRADRWNLYASDPLSVSRGRGTTLGSIHDEHGSLIASFVQEVNIRP